jgi:alpha/beta superfamily hydrolase
MTSGAKPPISERLDIAGPAGPLQAIVEDRGSEATDAFAVVCHPHPLYGGTMDNKVVVTVARALQHAGMSTVRFNFRGVGGSGGTYDEGRGETLDAEAVADWAARRWPGRALVSAGFSFGSFVALKLALSRGASRLVTVAPAVTRFGFSDLPRPDCPWLIVQGDADEVVEPRMVIEWAQSLRPAPNLVVMPGVGHFFHGVLGELKRIVISEIRSGASRSGA